MKFGSSSLFMPVTSSLREYFAPFMIWHLSPVTSSRTKILPSQGEETVLGISVGHDLVIFLVKKELKVGYSFKGCSISLRLTA